ncbi:hypothetical protein QUF72_10595 [Desulfobacterales bacterium HSG2]|nr:hypothetical protein [Desulfobacterales bacterium HSG2]
MCLGIISVLILIPLLVWRLRFIREMFETGTEGYGIIYEISYGTGKWKGGANASFYYNYRGKTYYSKRHIKLVKPYENLKRGDKLKLLIDPQKPARILMRDLYLEICGL